MPNPIKSGWENMHLDISTVTCCILRHLTRPDPSLLPEDSLTFKLSGNYSSPVGLGFLPCLRIVSQQTNNTWRNCFGKEENHKEVKNKWSHLFHLLNSFLPQEKYCIEIMGNFVIFKLCEYEQNDDNKNRKMVDCIQRQLKDSFFFSHSLRRREEHFILVSVDVTGENQSTLVKTLGEE